MKTSGRYQQGSEIGTGMGWRGGNYVGRDVGEFAATSIAAGA